MRIALVYDLRDDYRALGFSEEEMAEFDNVDTIDQLDGALRALGCEVERVGRGQVLAARLAAGERFDLVFTIAEGREGPLARGAGACALRAVRPALSVVGPAHQRLSPRQGGGQAAGARRRRADARLHGGDLDASELAGWSEFPAFVKPIAEGTGKGCESASVVNTSQELAAAAAKLLARYQPAGAGRDLFAWPRVHGRHRRQRRRRGRARRVRDPAQRGCRGQYLLAAQQGALRGAGDLRASRRR